MIVNGESVSSASLDDVVEVILPKTGFYIESGGQVNDEGYIRSPLWEGQGEGDWEIEITSARRAAAGTITHIGQVISGQPKVGDKAVAEVDTARRHDIMRNHTATHLLHKALHEVLGDHARQAGSLVSPKYLRFDFTQPDAMTPEQIERVEKMVNEAIAADMPVVKVTKSLDEAKKEGAMALFGEKYGEIVRTVSILDSDSLLSESPAASCLTPKNTPSNSAAAHILTAPQTLAHSSSSAKVRRRQAFAASKRSRVAARMN